MCILSMENFYLSYRLIVVAAPYELWHHPWNWEPSKDVDDLKKIPPEMSMTSILEPIRSTLALWGRELVTTIWGNDMVSCRQKLKHVIMYRTFSRLPASWRMREQVPEKMPCVARTYTFLNQAISFESWAMNKKADLCLQARIPCSGDMVC